MLRRRQRVQSIEHRSTELMQRREGQFHLRLDADCTSHLKSRGLARAVAQQCALPNPSFAANHQDRAFAVPSGAKQVVQ